MSKKERRENLATFVGLRAAHEILIKLTNKPESVPHLEQEADTYADLSSDLAEGDWNPEDIGKIEELARKICSKKLDRYKDLEGYDEIDSIIKNIMIDLELDK